MDDNYFTEKMNKLNKTMKNISKSIKKSLNSAEILDDESLFSIEELKKTKPMFKKNNDLCNDDLINKSIIVDDFSDLENISPIAGNLSQLPQMKKTNSVNKLKLIHHDDLSPLPPYINNIQHTDWTPPFSKLPPKCINVSPKYNNIHKMMPSFVTDNPATSYYNDVLPPSYYLDSLQYAPPKDASDIHLWSHNPDHFEKASKTLIMKEYEDIQNSGKYRVSHPMISTDKISLSNDNPVFYPQTRASLFYREHFSYLNFSFKKIPIFIGPCNKKEMVIDLHKLCTTFHAYFLADTYLSFSSHVNVKKIEFSTKINGTMTVIDSCTDSLYEILEKLDFVTNRKSYSSYIIDCPFFFKNRETLFPAGKMLNTYLTIHFDKPYFDTNLTLIPTLFYPTSMEINLFGEMMPRSDIIHLVGKNCYKTTIPCDPSLTTAIKLPFEHNIIDIIIKVKTKSPDDKVVLMGAIKNNASVAAIIDEHINELNLLKYTKDKINDTYVIPFFLDKGSSLLKPCGFLNVDEGAELWLDIVGYVRSDTNYDNLKLKIYARRYDQISFE